MKQQRLRVVENLLVWISKHSWNILDLAKIVKERRIHSEYSGWQSDLLTGIPVRALNTVCRRVQYTTGTELRSLRRVPYYQKASDRLSSSRGVIMLSLTKHEFYFWSVLLCSLSLSNNFERRGSRAPLEKWKHLAGSNNKNIGTNSQASKAFTISSEIYPMPRDNINRNVRVWTFRFRFISRHQTSR